MKSTFSSFIEDCDGWACRSRLRGLDVYSSWLSVGSIYDYFRAFGNDYGYIWNLTWHWWFVSIVFRYFPSLINRKKFIDLEILHFFLILSPSYSILEEKILFNDKSSRNINLRDSFHLLNISKKYCFLEELFYYIVILLNFL